MTTSTLSPGRQTFPDPDPDRDLFGMLLAGLYALFAAFLVALLGWTATQGTPGDPHAGAPIPASAPDTPPADTVAAA